MKKNILLLIVLVIFLTGCGSSKMEEHEVDYNLNITDVFKESITVALSKDAEKIAAKESENDSDLTSLEYYFLETDQNPIFSNFDELYIKETKKYNNMVEVNLNYNYPEKYFVYNNYITSCFSNYDIISGDDYFEVKLSGSFICNSLVEKLNISINTDYKVLESNGKKNGNTYSWSFDKKDFENIEINYSISRKYSSMAKEADNFSNKKGKRNSTIRNLRIVVLVIILLVIAVFAVRFYFMKRDVE